MKNVNEFSFQAGHCLILMMTLIFAFVFSCAEKSEKSDGSTAFNEKLTCEGCHTDQEVLQKLAPGIDEPPPSSGGG